MSDRFPLRVISEYVMTYDDVKICRREKVPLTNAGAHKDNLQAVS